MNGPRRCFSYEGWKSSFVNFHQRHSNKYKFQIEFFFEFWCRFLSIFRLAATFVGDTFFQTPLLDLFDFWRSFFCKFNFHASGEDKVCNMFIGVQLLKLWREQFGCWSSCSQQVLSHPRSYWVCGPWGIRKSDGRLLGTSVMWSRRE